MAKNGSGVTCFALRERRVERDPAIRARAARGTLRVPPSLCSFLFVAYGACSPESIRGVVPDSIIRVSSRGARRDPGGRQWPDAGLVTIGQVDFLAWEYLVDVRYLRISLYKCIEGIAGTKMLKRQVFERVSVSDQDASFPINLRRLGWRRGVNRVRDSFSESWGRRRILGRPRFGRYRQDDRVGIELVRLLVARRGPCS